MAFVVLVYFREASAPNSHFRDIIRVSLVSLRTECNRKKPSNSISQVLYDPRLQFYRLPEKRPDVVTFDRMSAEYMDEMGHLTKENYAPIVDPYPCEVS